MYVIKYEKNKNAVKNALFVYTCFIHVFSTVNINKRHINNERTAGNKLLCLMS